MQFSKPYVANIICSSLPKTTEVKTNADMGKLTIAVPRSSTQDTQVTKNAPAGTNILRFDDDAAAIQAVVSGQVQAVGGNMFYIDRFDEAKPGVYENKLEFTRIYNGACTRLGEKEINARSTRSSTRSRRNGELAKIHEKWMKHAAAVASRRPSKAFPSSPADTVRQSTEKKAISDMTSRADNRQSSMTIQPMIVMQGVEKWYGTFQALKSTSI